MKQSILFVDDEPNVLEAYRRSLRDQQERWQMQFVASPFEALELLAHERFDAVVSDVRMPAIDGLELMARMRRNAETCDIPVVIVTGQVDRGLRGAAIDAGAIDLLNKPIDRDELLARLRSVLRGKLQQDQLRRTNEQLEHRVRRRTAQLAASRVDIVLRLARAAECRDQDSGNHVLRVACYSRSIAETLGLDAEFIDTLFLAAPLHDVGKIGVPDAILVKSGRLTGPEWRAMQRHCEIGESILRDDLRLLRPLQSPGSDWPLDEASDNPLLDMAASIARSHHEQWDGGGYPDALAGSRIPLCARIVAVADVFDELRSTRPCKPSFTLDRTLEVLAEAAGRHFDPAIHSAFEASLPGILRWEAELSDTTEVSNWGQADVKRIVC